MDNLSNIWFDNISRENKNNGYVATAMTSITKPKHFREVVEWAKPDWGERKEKPFPRKMWDLKLSFLIAKSLGEERFQQFRVRIYHKVQRILISRWSYKYVNMFFFFCKLTLL